MNYITCLHGSLSPVTQMTRSGKIKQARDLGSRLETVLIASFGKKAVQVTLKELSYRLCQQQRWYHKISIDRLTKINSKRAACAARTLEHFFPGSQLKVEWTIRDTY